MKYNSLRNNSYWTLISLLAIILLNACSDITDRQREYLDMGETIYVGKMDSVVVHGGKNRVVIKAKNTYLRTAVKCVVKWTDIEGMVQEKIFDLEEFQNSDYTFFTIDPLPEGDYDFELYTMDDVGNKSVVVETAGSSYGNIYMQTQPKLSIIDLFVNDDGGAELTLSQSKMAVKYELTYTDVEGQKKTIEAKEIKDKIIVPNWENNDNSQFELTTFVLPSDKLGLDTLELPTLVQVARQHASFYPVDKSKIISAKYTATDNTGKGFGSGAPQAIFDNQSGGDAAWECWNAGSTLPAHMSFDLGKQTYLTAASIIGRNNYFGWDVVKIEIWGRESIEDGPSGPTGYEIQSRSDEEGFEAEAITRGWKKVGNGWFKYANPRNNPQTSSCELTDLDHSFKPRHILLRIMSCITPDGSTPSDKYFGEDGGYTGGGKYFNIGEMGLTATGITYTIE